MRIHAIAFVLVGIIGLTGRSEVFAQSSSGHLLIRVTDKSNAVVPHAQVAFRPEVRGVPTDAETGVDGTLLITAPPGAYTISVTYPWFTPGVTKIHVERMKTEEVPIILEAPREMHIVHTGDHSPVKWDQHPVPPKPVAVVLAVNDESGVAVPYAQVWVGSESCGVPDADCGGRKADEGGKLKLKLAPGFYEIAVTRPFFVRWRKQEIRIEAEPATIRVVLTAIAAQ